MRKAWIIVALVVTLGLVVGGAGVAIAEEPNEEPINAPRLLQPVEPEVLPHNLCLIRGTVINQPVEEGLIVVEGKMLRRPTPANASDLSPTGRVFTVMVDENTKYRVPDDREPSLAGILEGDRVWIAAQELEDGSLLAKRVVVAPGEVRVIRLRHALLVMNREREMMALAIPQMRIVIIAKPIKIVPFRELPFDQELLPLELPSLLEPQ
ncbi:MAG: hypothetical protein KAX23_03955 [Dehalococcoidia bacterium]|jgi:hypothetical protein|nr:hypothetical protein [Chloroflexota bacterium]MCK4242686.1 hypothetical protein [Dehalococcoidia bacterium]